MRKHSSYSENKIFPAAKLEDLRTDLIVNKEAGKYTQHWPLLAANDRYGTFKNLRIIPKDPMTGKEGFALAGILLFGKDEIIATTVPSFRIALIKRVDNYDRYETID